MTDLWARDTTGACADYAAGRIDLETAVFRLTFAGFSSYEAEQMLLSIDEPVEEPDAETEESG